MALEDAPEALDGGVRHRFRGVPGVDAQVPAHEKCRRAHRKQKIQKAGKGYMQNGGVANGGATHSRVFRANLRMEESVRLLECNEFWTLASKFFVEQSLFRLIASSK